WRPKHLPPTQAPRSRRRVPQAVLSSKRPFAVEEPGSRGSTRLRRSSSATERRTITLLQAEPFHGGGAASADEHPDQVSLVLHGAVQVGERRHFLGRDLAGRAGLIGTRFDWNAGERILRLGHAAGRRRDRADSD